MPTDRSCRSQVGDGRWVKVGRNMTNQQKSGAASHELELLDRYWRAANYLSVGQIYLLDNPLLREPLKPEHVKSRLLGHWGTTPGLNFIYAHLNRVIRALDLNVIYVCGPGHGGPGMVANTYLEGSYSEIYPEIARNADGLRKLFRQFSFPGGIPSHAAPETPGSIHEGGELGYALVHAYGAAFDNPNLIVACVVGVAKAYTTRVGEGPMPSEDIVVGDLLHGMGREYGATTGRERRCGWFDAVTVRQAVMVNGITDLAVTNFDGLDTLPEVKVCVAYRVGSKRFDLQPTDFDVLARCKPVYETFPGWQKPTDKIRKWKDLPLNARRYGQALAKLTGTRLRFASVGPARSQTITL